MWIHNCRVCTKTEMCICVLFFILTKAHVHTCVWVTRFTCTPPGFHPPPMDVNRGRNALEHPLAYIATYIITLAWLRHSLETRRYGYAAPRLFVASMALTRVPVHRHGVDTLVPTRHRGGQCFMGLVLKETSQSASPFRTKWNIHQSARRWLTRRECEWNYIN